MRERLMMLKNKLNLTQVELASALGINQSAVSKILSGATNLTDQNVKLICKTYKVSEEWLRHGVGEMFEISTDDYILELQKEYNLSETSVTILKKYVLLNSDQRKIFDDVLIDLASKPQD